jgi:tetratricopeptide (TPR) repeat protein
MKKAEFKAIVLKLNEEELRRFVLHYGNSDNDFRAGLGIFFSDKQSDATIEQSFRSLLASIIKNSSSRGYIDYKSASNFASKIDELVHRGESYAAEGKLVTSFLVAKALLEPVMTAAKNIDDSSGYVGGTIDSIIQLLGTISSAKDAPTDLKEKILDFLEVQLQSEVYFEYGDFGEDMFVIYQSIAAQLEKVEPYEQLISKLLIKAGRYKKGFLIFKQIDFYKAIGEADKEAALITANMEIKEVRKLEVDKAIGQENYSKAKSLINVGIKIAKQNNHPGIVTEWEKNRLVILELEGDVSGVRALTKSLIFDSFFSLKYYQKWKATFTPVELVSAIEGFINERIQLLEKRYQNKMGYYGKIHPPILDNLAGIYFEEKYFDRVLELVRKEKTLESVLQFHKQLVPVFPDELLQIYLPLLEREGDMASERRMYANLAKNMKNLIKDMPKGKNQIQNIAEKLKSKYPRRPAMLEELNKVM